MSFPWKGAARPMSPDFLAALLAYDAETGFLTWRPRPVCMFRRAGNRSQEAECRRWNSTYAGKRAGSEPSGRGLDRYRKVRICGKGHAEHRVIWLMAYGVWPDERIDHINGDRTDNRLCNLRLAGAAQNSANTTASWGVSRYRGVSYRPRKGWRAAVTYEGIRTGREGFACETAAAIWRDQQALALAGEFAGLNIDGGQSRC